MTNATPIRLTSLATSAGCAAKVGPGTLSHLLGELGRSDDPRLLVGFETHDDAGVYQLTPELALVQTVDFFPPMVDDPYTFGAIAATNAISDVYAMGGKPLTALNIVTFPTRTVSTEVLAEILRGGADKAREAGVVILGGHTVEDAVPKYGLAVTGTIDPRHVFTNAGARAGDALILTKPIGTGVLNTALKSGVLGAAAAEAARRSMTTLNRAASEVMVRRGAHAATDVTGFGLLGHLHELAHASGVRAEISFSAVPLLPEALDWARRDEVPGGTGRNLAYLRPFVRFAPELELAEQQLLADPQTSGGLLLAVAEGDADGMLAELAENGVQAWRIGHCGEGAGIDVRP